MKRIVLLVGLLVVAGVLPASAGPVAFSYDYCPGSNGCPAGVTHASLTFADNLSTADDTNDYLVDVYITGTALAPYYVDEISITTPAPTPGGYDSQPSIVLAPGQGELGTGSPWIVYYSNVNASSGSCTGNTYNSQEVCVQSGPGVTSNYGAELQGQTLHWELIVNLAAGYTITQSSGVNLRAQFLTQDGKNAGILSPVPEPTTLAMLGVSFGAFLVSKRRTIFG